MSQMFSRRRFLLQLAVLSGTALLSRSAHGSDQPPSWVAVGPASAFPQDKFSRTVLPAPSRGAVVYIKRTGQDKFLALSGRCTHKGCPVDWNGSRRQFVCPCHQGVYDETGHNISGPPPGPLPILVTRVDEHGTLFVRSTS